MLCFAKECDTIRTMKTLQIVFCILSALSVAAVVPVAIFFEYYCLIPVGTAFLFGLAMFAAKRAATPKLPKPDFMNSQEENDRINAYLKEHKDDE